MTDHATTALGAEPADSPGERAFADPHRPRYHFVAPSGWLNDPNGMVHWNGRYHLFYQHNPHRAVHADVHWGHASSVDLVHWEDEPVALTPSPDGPDRDGCWSGVLVDDGGVPTIIYSGNHDAVGQRTCLAVGDQHLRTWTKEPTNPVIADLPSDLDLLEYRDHCVWRQDGEWRQLIGSGIRDRGGTALLYRSTDLRSWEYIGPLVIGDLTRRDPVWTGSMWECVDLFRLGEEHEPAPDVLLGSAWHAGQTRHPFALVGRYADTSFEVVHEQLLDFGLGSFYAPQSMRDEIGRRIVMGWMQEGRTDSAVHSAGWGGVMSMPRVATLDKHGTLRLAPAPEVEALRRDHVGVGRFTVPLGRTIEVTAGDQLDLLIAVRLPVGGLLHLDVRTTPDGQERTTLTLDGTAPNDTARLVLDRSTSSLDPTVDDSLRSGPVSVGPDRLVELRVLVDHSALEAFANGRPLSTRVYPTRQDALSVRLRTERCEVLVDSMDTWQMADVWIAPREVRFAALDEGASMPGIG